MIVINIQLDFEGDYLYGGIVACVDDNPTDYPLALYDPTTDRNTKISDLPCSIYAYQDPGEALSTTGELLTELGYVLNFPSNDPDRETAIEQKRATDSYVHAILNF